MNATHWCQGRCDDGADDNVISPVVAKAAASQVVGKITKISTVILQVALKNGSQAQRFTSVSYTHLTLPTILLV